MFSSGCRPRLKNARANFHEPRHQGLLLDFERVEKTLGMTLGFSADVGERTSCLIAERKISQENENTIGPGAIIRDRDRKRAPFLVLGLAP